MKRRGFSMILAIVFIVIIATLGMLALAMSAQAAKSTEETYLREQANMLAMNAAELAILAMQESTYAENSNSNTWLDTVEVFYPEETDWLLRATVDIDYMSQKTLSGVNQALNNIEAAANGITTSRDNIAMLKITVESNPDLVNDRIRIFRSTVQRP